MEQFCTECAAMREVHTKSVVIISHSAVLLLLFTLVFVKEVYAAFARLLTATECHDLDLNSELPHYRTTFPCALLGCASPSRVNEESGYQRGGGWGSMVKTAEREE